MIGIVKETAPLSFVLLGGSLILFVLLFLRSRLSAFALVAALVLLGVGIEAGCFDGKPHLTQKLDATFWIFFRSVEYRIVAGAVTLLLSAPIGHAVGRLVEGRRGFLYGLVVLGSYGLALLASGLCIFSATLAAFLGELPAAERLDVVRQAVRASTYILLTGAGGSILAAVAVAVSLLRREHTSAPAADS